MKKFKKILATIIATATLATSALSLSASALTNGATVTRNFSVGSYTVTASVSLGYIGNDYYGAATSCSNSAVTNREVFLFGDDSNGTTINNSGYSYSGTASTSVYAVNTFTRGRSYHTARYGSTTGSTNMTF